MSNKSEQTAEQVQVKPTEEEKQNTEKKNTDSKAVDKQAEKDQKAKRKEEKKKQKEEKKKNKIPRKRIFPIPLRIIVVLLLAGLALMIGLMIGYGVLGDGNPSDVLQKETWQHIIDIVVKEE